MPRAIVEDDLGLNPTMTLVANSAEASGTRGHPFAGGRILPRLRLGDPRREFATSVNTRATNREPRASHPNTHGAGASHTPPRSTRIRSPVGRHAPAKAGGRASIPQG